MKHRSCNYSKPNVIGDKGLCLCEGECRETCAAYEIKCKIYHEICIRNTQNFFKQQIQVHVLDAAKLKNRGIYSDSFAKYFPEHLPSQPISPKDAKLFLSIRTLKRMKPIEVSKGFGSNKC